MSRTAADLHRIAAHILGRRRFDVSGHFGLRASPGGIATPAFGPEAEVLRIAGGTLVREVGSEATRMTLAGASLSELARFAAVDLAAPFSAGENTPPLGVTDAPLHLDADELADLSAWFDLGWRVLDACTGKLDDSWTCSTVQLWPEHFDVGVTVERRGGPGVNLGFSPGDGFSPEPYVYVGPWGPERPGDPTFWNAPFGAFVTRADAGNAATALSFLRRGLDLVTTRKET